MNTTIGTSLDEAKSFLEGRETVGIPTETVYGLAANALNSDAVLKIFTAKNRPHFDPLIVHTHSREEIAKYVTHIPAVAEKLIDAFMPGPLTVLLNKQSIIPDLVTSGLESVAIRIPNHALTLALLRSLSFPLAAPSANPFGYISPTTAQHVYDQLHGKIPYVLDGGATTVGVESTIVGFEDGEVIVYRLGGLAIEEIEQVAGRVRMNVVESSNPQTPGMLKSHYAPRKKLIIMSSSEWSKELQGKHIGVIAFNQYIEGVDTKQQILLSPEGNLNEAAKNLFAAMRKLDAGDVELIVAVKFPDVGLGRAINDRLKRAAY
ncbi:MAG: L-threonylcarbamoyladenylate synthase [Chitinophagales bacterium]